MLFYIGVVSINGILEREIMSPWRPKVTLKVAFKFGSSKHGNARRASLLHLRRGHVSVWQSFNSIIEVTNKHNLACLPFCTIFSVNRTIKSPHLVR
jgi:hypothetical protein